MRGSLAQARRSPPRAPQRTCPSRTVSRASRCCHSSWCLPSDSPPPPASVSDFGPAIQEPRNLPLVLFQHDTDSAYGDFLLEKSSIALCVPIAWNIPGLYIYSAHPAEEEGGRDHLRSMGCDWCQSIFVIPGPGVATDWKVDSGTPAGYAVRFGL